MAKYNQLLRIEEDLGDIASYPGRAAFYNLRCEPEPRRLAAAARLRPARHAAASSAAPSLDRPAAGGAGAICGRLGARSGTCSCATWPACSAIELQAQLAANDPARAQRNARLAAEVSDLKEGLEMVEEKARAAGTGHGASPTRSSCRSAKGRAEMRPPRLRRVAAPRGATATPA
jgi:hypothetical protein